MGQHNHLKQKIVVIFWIIPTTIQLLSLSQEYFSKNPLWSMHPTRQLRKGFWESAIHMSPHDQTLVPTLDKCPKSSFHSQCQITHGFCRLTRTYIPHNCPTLNQGHKQALPGIRKRAVRYGWGCQHGQPLGLERPLGNVVRVGRKPTQIFS